MMSIDLTEIIVAIITLLFAVITRYLVPMIKAKTDEQKLTEIKVWVKAAVEAAQQIYVGTGKGADKKAFVVEFLESKGYNIDIDSIDKLIEAEVHNLVR